MKLMDKILGFFGLGYEDEKRETWRLYDAIKDDIPKITHDSRTPIERLIVSYDPALAGLSKLKSPGEKLRHVRKSRGMTQGDLSELTGISRSTIGEIENNKWKTTSLETACTLADELDIAVTDIWDIVLNK